MKLIWLYILWKLYTEQSQKHWYKLPSTGAVITGLSLILINIFIIIVTLLIPLFNINNKNILIIIVVTLWIPLFKNNNKYYYFINPLGGDSVFKVQWVQGWVSGCL